MAEGGRTQVGRRGHGAGDHNRGRHSRRTNRRDRDSHRNRSRGGHGSFGGSCPHGLRGIVRGGVQLILHLRSGGAPTRGSLVVQERHKRKRLLEFREAGARRGNRVHRRVGGSDVMEEVRVWCWGIGCRRRGAGASSDGYYGDPSSYGGSVARSSKARERG